MNYRINVLLFFLLLVIGVQADAQKKAKSFSYPQLTNLKIGSQIPDVVIPNIINDKYASIKTSAFSEQLLIVDFWFTNCSACVTGLPKMMALQREFGDRIKVLPVTFEEKGLVSKFLKTSRKTKDLVVPTVVEDRLLSRIFKHISSPHEVWIYKGKVIAITEADYVTRENIDFVLNGGKNEWPVKDDFLPPIDFKTPLVRQNIRRFTGDFPLHRYAAIFGCYQDGVFAKSGTLNDSIKNTRRDYMINVTIANAYINNWNIATGNFRFPEPSHILFEVKDLTRYVRQEDSKEYDFISRKKTFISYESVSPDTGQTDQQAARAVIADLDNLLGLHGRYEKRKVKCLGLIRIDSVDRIKSKVEDGQNSGSLIPPFIKFNNQSLSNSLVQKMNRFYGNPPVFDETGYKSSVDMEFTLDSWQNIPALRKILKNYGLDLKEEEREMEVFVLTEKGN